VKRYRTVRREPIVHFISKALERCGARILSPADPSLAPFEFVIETPEGERLELVCYAFLTNKYGQKGRPSDEHRFQVKYGSKSEGFHRLHLPDRPGQVTLLFGVHLRERLFIACDPAMHERTRFFRSVEFKTGHLERAEENGWFGWERDRSPVRRKLPPPMEDARTEVLLAFAPERFLQYVGFERVATGMDPGERLLLADKIGATSAAPATGLIHPLERELGLTSTEILDMIGNVFRLKAAIRGSAAELHLGEYLREVPGVSNVRSIDEDGKPDFEIVFRKRPVLIECKNVLRRTHADGSPLVDFQKTRASKRNPCSRYYKADQFDVLAACLHPLTERWEYRFVTTSMLAPHATCVGRLSQRVMVSGAHWHSDLESLLKGASGSS
jgi:hypothetical protein